MRDSAVLASAFSPRPERVSAASGLVLYPLTSTKTQKKIDQMTSGCVAMSSGDALLATEVIEKSRAQLAAVSNATVQQVADAVRAIYMALHLQRAEQVILHPRGLTFREYKEKGAQQIPLQVYVSIDQLLFNFGIGVVEFLVAGTDSTGGHIFRVHYNGMAGGSWMEWCDKIGHRAIGSGALHASLLLAMEGQHRGRPASETLYNVYCAKRTSEVAPGVGSATDLAVITKDKIEAVSDATLKKLAEVREKHQRQQVTKKELEGV